jgi:hypothetical protein
VQYVGNGQDAGRHDASRALQDYLTANYARLRQRLERRLGCADAASECLHETWLHLARVVLLSPRDSFPKEGVPLTDDRPEARLPGSRFTRKIDRVEATHNVAPTARASPPRGRLR